jgi:large conductance mechanosensitive channel
MLKGFKQFILRGNVIDLAVGVVVGAAFNGVVTSLVKDIITPVIGAIFKTPDFHDLYFTVNESKFLYGDFISSLISFILVAASVYFFVVTPINALVSRMRHKAPLDPTTKKCPECKSEISIEATRCAFCTIQLSHE